MTGGSATLFANRTGGGDVIAGDVRIAKAVESVTGIVTYVELHGRLHPAQRDSRRQRHPE